MKNIVLFAFISFLLFACNKPIYDYRSKYVGTYQVIQYNKSWISGQAYSYDTSYYDIKVERSDEIYYVNFISDGGKTKYLLENYITPLTLVILYNHPQSFLLIHLNV